MPDPTIEFEATYTDALIDDAAKTFVSRLFRKYLVVLVAACVLNVVGFVAVLMLPGSHIAVIIAVGFIAALGPAYLPWAYFRLPVRFATPMKENLKSTVYVSLNPSSFRISVKAGTFTRQWSEIKAIFEYPEYFLFVVTPLMFTFVPKKDTPQEAQRLIREASRLLVQSNPAPQRTAASGRH